MPLKLKSTGGGDVTLDVPSTASSLTATVPAQTGTLSMMQLMTAQTASGTSVNFTDIPAWAERITVAFSGISTSGTSNIIIQLGDAGGVEVTGYLGASTRLADSTAVSAANYTTGFGIAVNSAAAVIHGIITIALINASTNLWAASGALGYSNSAGIIVSGGSKSLSETLTQVRITTVNGTDTFDAGTVNVLYEG